MADWASIVPLVTAGVTAAGKIAADRQAGRQAQAQAQVPVDTLNQRAYETDLSGKQRGLEAQEAGLLARALGVLQEQAAARKAPGERAASSVQGDILANARDVSFNGLSSRIPKFSFEGGLRPSMLSANSRQLGGEMSRAALMDQMKGEATPFSDLAGPDFSSVINAPGAPKGTPLPEGSKLDSILGAIAQYGGLGAGLAEAYQRPPANVVPSAPGVSPLTSMPGVPVAPPGPPPAPAPMLAGRMPVGNMATTPTARGY